MYFASLSWKKAANLDESIVAVIPVGSVEAHGPIGPLGTDYCIPSAISCELEKRMPDKLLILPPVPFGCSPFLTGFPGTIDIGFDALLATLKGISDGVMRCGVKKILFLNGHGGNSPAIDHAALYIYRKGGQSASIDWWILCGQLRNEWRTGHGGGIETSVMMAIKPGWVFPEELFEKEHVHFSPVLKNIHIHEVKFREGSVKMIRDVCDSIPSACAGYDDSPSSANAEVGRSVLAVVIDYSEAFLEEFMKIELKNYRNKNCIE